MKIFVNGKWMDEAHATVSVFDHGLLYGDGVFEGIRAYNGRVFRLDEHIARLFRSAHAMLIKIPFAQAELREWVLQTVRANDLRDAYIRVTLTRGVGLGLDPRNIKTEPTVVIIASQLSLYPESDYTDGLEVVTVSTRVPRPDTIDVRVKSLGKYINNIMAKFEANQRGAGEGLMLTPDGLVAEATGDNIFIVEGGGLYTPPPSAGILQGITRQAVIELAGADGIPFAERNLTLYDVYTADEAFLTGTAAEMVPMVRLDDRTIGTGRPGPLTLRLTKAFRRLTQESGVPV